MSDIDNEPIHLDQWVKINRFLVFYKFMAIFSMLIALLLIGNLIFTSLKPPLVIENLSSGSGHKIWNAKYESLAITKDDINDLIRNFILARYEWSEFNIDKIADGIRPFVSEGLFKQIKKDLQNQQFKEINAPNEYGGNNEASGNEKNRKLPKSINERVLISKIDIGDKSIIADFDRVIGIEGVKIVSSTQIALEIIEGEVTYKNPLGIYINGVTEHEKN
ncbi:MAG: hypothetical protein HQK49_17085 [Oligoflexia bacterium]|nr:hypothetical protein [Oligoflexia bacterium]